MMLPYFLDHNIQQAVVEGLKRRRLDVVSATDWSATRDSNERLFELATRANRVIVTHDHDFLKLAAAAQREARDFPGVVFCVLVNVSVGTLLDDLELIARALSPQDIANRVIRVPL
jgi:predicted nuclease of predicted toxin-antitoxin system